MKNRNNICIHWTGGNYIPCDEDLKAYHYLIDNLGRIYLGLYSPEDNINCYDGIYAKHCGGGNTNCIGIAACGMFNYDEYKKETRYPLTKKQIESLCALVGYLSLERNIDVCIERIFTHYEFEKTKPKSERKGKIDITYLHFMPYLNKDSVGHYLRNKIQWYKSKFQNNEYKLIKKGKYYEII